MRKIGFAAPHFSRNGSSLKYSSGLNCRFKVLAFPPFSPMHSQVHLFFLHVLAIFSVLFLDVSGEQLYRRAHVGSGLNSLGVLKRQTSCSSDEYVCFAGGYSGCCSLDETCTFTNTFICGGGQVACTASDEQSCGNNCCVSPLVCDESSLQCVQGSSPTHPQGGLLIY